MYCTIDDVRARFSEAFLLITTDDDADGIFDTAMIEGAIEEATAHIDGVLRHRFAVPFDPVPALVRDVCAALAGRVLARRVPQNEALRGADFAPAELTLARLAAGELRIEGIAPAARRMTATLSPEDREFTKESCNGY